MYCDGTLENGVDDIGGFEGKRRDSRERVIVPREGIINWVRSQRATGDE